MLRGETTKSRKTRFVSDGRIATPDRKAHFAPVSTGPVPRSSADAFAVSTIDALE